MTARCVLLIGTSKGAFLIDGDAGRADWRIRGPLCEGAHRTNSQENAACPA